MPRSKFGTFDLETDPFKPNRIPRAFAADFFDGREHHTTWGSNCVEQLLSIMLEYKGDIYAHNGGKFDFHYLLPFLPDEVAIMLIGSRIARLTIGKTRFKDSYLILPIPLAATGEKQEIDYDDFEEDKRDANKKRIIDYMRQDNVALYNLVTNFRNEFGSGLTLAGRALNYMQSNGYNIPRSYESFDDSMRPYYYGGRVQCFESGTIEGDIKYYDINSAYPAAMMNEEHMFSSDILTTKKLPKYERDIKKAFVQLRAKSSGCLPFRDFKTGKVSFPTDERMYYATGHEIIAGLETNTLEIIKIEKVINPLVSTTFKDYIEHLYNKRMYYKKLGKDNLSLLYKLVMNSSYGKFALNPRKFQESLIHPTGEPLPKDDTGIKWIFVNHIGDSGFTLYQRPAMQRGKSFYNVGTAASITGAVRAFLWKSICSIDRPLYCDTDCIMFTGKHDLKLGEKLGEWSVEAEGQAVHIAGKKLYAFHEKNGNFKTASKGVRISAEEIIKVSQGQESHWENMAPTFSLKNPTKFIKRKVRKTADLI